MMNHESSDSFDAEWDAGERGCGELVIKLRLMLRKMAPGAVVRVRTTDVGAVIDLPAWCNMTGDRLLRYDADNHHYYIARGDY